MDSLFPYLWSVFLTVCLTLPFLLFTLAVPYTFSLVTRAYDEIGLVRDKGRKPKISRDTFRYYFHHTVTLIVIIAFYCFFSFLSGCFLSDINSRWSRRMAWAAALAQFLIILIFLLARYRAKQDDDERWRKSRTLSERLFHLGLPILMIWVWLCFSLFLTILCVRWPLGFLSLSPSFNPLFMLEDFHLRIPKLIDFLPLNDLIAVIVITLSMGLLVLCLIRIHLAKNSGKEAGYWLVWLIALGVFAGVVSGFLGSLKIHNCLSLHRYGGTTLLTVSFIIIGLAVVGIECWRHHDRRTMPLTTAFSILVCLYPSAFTTALVLNEKRIAYMLVALAIKLALLSTWIGYVRHTEPVGKILSLMGQRMDND